MDRIKVLPSLLVNKIAAGEVIERPASVVKELIENALDAGASRIVIEAADGGKKLIRVSDNGCGMSPADLEKAFLSHTTSKIDTEDDLNRIQTFGFRGEALASIGAVSRARLTSKLQSADSAEAYAIEINGGELSQLQPAAGSTGTIVEIRNLFFNTPARQKFLKSTAVEMGHLTETVTRFAIAHPEIQFDLISNQKNILNLPPVADPPAAYGGPRSWRDGEAGVKERLRVFFGDELVSQLLPVEDESFRAYISNPLITKPTTRWQFFFLNRRFIRDRTISNAVRQAYYEIIPAGRHPAVFLFINLPFGEYDVNVHPTKLEVRFRQGWRIHDNIAGGIRKKLLESELPAAAAPVTAPWPGSPAVQRSDIPQGGTQAGQIGSLTVPDGIGTGQQSGSMMQALVDFFKTHQAGHFQSRLPDQPSLSQADGQVMTQPIIRPGSLEPDEGLQRVFQIHNAYIITEDRDGLLIFDQHALHERILFNRFKEEMRTAVIYRQKLLVPVLVELEVKELGLLAEVKPCLEKVGLEIEEFGGRTVSIRAVPQILHNVDLPELIHELLDTFLADKDTGTDDSSNRNGGNDAAEAGLDEIIRLMACKAAVKAGNRLSREEMQTLLKTQESSGYTGTCPHGRPAVFKLTLAELEKYFQR